MARSIADRATNGPRLLAYVTGTLVPILKRGTLILDNLSVHKGSGVRQAIKAALSTIRSIDPSPTGC